MKFAEAAARQEERSARYEVISAAFERDPRSYGEDMSRSKRVEWQTAMQEKIMPRSRAMMCGE